MKFKNEQKMSTRQLFGLMNWAGGFLVSGCADKVRSVRSSIARITAFACPLFAKNVRNGGHTPGDGAGTGRVLKGVATGAPVGIAVRRLPIAEKLLK